MPLIQLTGPPRFIDANGREIQMENHPDFETTSYVLSDETLWDLQSNKTFKAIEGIKYSRPRFRFGYNALEPEVAAPLIRALKLDTITFYPRTRASSDSADEVEVGFKCRVVNNLRFTQHIKRGVPELEIELESLSPIANPPLVLGGFEATISSSQITSFIDGFVGTIDLAEYPTCSSFWDNVSENGANIRVRDAAGAELPFKLSEDFNLIDRVGHIHFKSDVSDISNTVVSVIAADMLVPALPMANDLNGSENVFVDKWAWLFEELNGSAQVEDVSASADHLNATNIDDSNIDHGQVGYAFKLNDGVSDEHFVTTDLVFPELYFCIEAWVKVDAATSDATDMGIFSINNDLAGGAALATLLRNSSNQWEFKLSDTTDAVTSIVSGAITDDAFQHLFVAFFNDGTNNVIRLFVNGGLGAADVTFSGTRSVQSGEPIVGALFDADTLQDHFEGWVDEVVLYDGLPSSLNSLNAWVAQRYNSQRDSQSLFTMSPEPADTLEQGWDNEPLSKWFPAEILDAHNLGAIGVVGDEVIIASGSDATGAMTTAVHAYNYKTNVWRVDTSMPAARVGAAYGVIDDVLYVAGGWDGSAETNTLYARDPDTGAWSTLAVVPVTTNGAASAVLEGELYSISGSRGGSVTTGVHKYNPVSDTWSVVSALPAARFLAAAVLQNGKILVHGGDSGGSVQSSTYEFEEGIGWTTKASSATGRSAHRMVEFQGFVYTIGGRTGSAQSTITNAVLTFAPTNSWDTASFELPYSASGIHPAVIDDVLMIFGGNDDSSNGLTNVNGYAFLEDTDHINVSELRSVDAIDSVWHISNGSTDYDPLALPGSARRSSAIGIIDNRFIIVGGGDSPSVADTYLYDPYGNGYNKGADYPITFLDAAHGVYNGELYIFGGFSGGGWISSANKYSPTTNTWESIADLPASMQGPSGDFYNGKFYMYGGGNGRMDEYDPVLDSWATLSNPPVSLDVPGGALYQDEFYFVGGFPASDDVIKYNPSTDTWSTMNAFPINAVSVRLFVHGSKLYAYVGDDDSAVPVLGTVYVYDEGLDSWSVHAAGASPVTVEIPALAIHGDRLYLFGGYDRDTLSFISSVQVYSFKKGWI